MIIDHTLVLKEFQNNGKMNHKFVCFSPQNIVLSHFCCTLLNQSYLNPYPTAFPYGNGMVLHFYQQQESSTTKTVHKVINKGLKLMYSRFTLVRISINLNSSQLNMFREIILPIFRSTRLCFTACGVMHPPRCCRPSAV